MRERAVHAVRLRRVAPHGEELEQRLARPLGQHAHLLLGVARVPVHGELPEPVVHHLVVVPLRHHGDAGADGLRVRVQLVVGEVAAEVVQALRRAALGLGDQVAPHRAVVQRHLGHQRLVGVDVVPRVDEQVGLGAAQGVVDAQAAAGLVDPPPLAHHVPRPRHAHRAVAAARGGAEVPGGPVAEGPRRVHALVARPPGDGLPRRQSREVEVGGERRLGARRGPLQPARVAEAVAGVPLHEPARRAVGAAPHDRAVAQHVAGLHAAREHGTEAFGGDDGGGALGGGPEWRPARHGGGAGGERGAQEGAAGEERIGHGVTPASRASAAEAMRAVSASTAAPTGSASSTA